MQWFAGIFEATTDQARLVTTIIAAIIAVAVVLLNQWFNSRRSRKETLIKKIEEIYSAVIKMQLLKSIIHNEIVSGYPSKPAMVYETNEKKNNEKEWLRKIDEKRDEFSNLGAQAYMLTGLYFPHLQKDITSIWTTFDKLYFVYAESENASDYILGAKTHIDSINNIFEETFKTLSNVMTETMH